MQVKIKSILHSFLTYKILVDIFLLLMIVSLVFIIAETFIPGLFTPYISPFTLFVLIFITCFFIALTAHKINAYTPIKSHSRAISIFIVTIFAILVGIAGYSYGFFFDSIIVLFAIAIFILLHHILKDITKP